jgi:hypothetical protein
MPPCGFTRASAFLLVVFAAAIQDVRAAEAQQHPKLDYRAIAVNDCLPVVSNLVK